MAAKLIAANWKMYKTGKEAEEYFSRWRTLPATENEVLFFPPFPLLPLVRGMLGPEKLGGQNCHDRKEGAFTGEVSPYLLKDVGCDYVLIGHSERRHVFGERNDSMASKVAAAMEAGLRPVYCVGEKLEERESGMTLAVVEGQLAALEGLAGGGYDIAYEPVWAIGTGKVARTEDASSVQGGIREWLDSRGLGRDARILYGGSVKPENSAELLSAPAIDGLLVGGASLDPLGFGRIAGAVV